MKQVTAIALRGDTKCVHKEKNIRFTGKWAVVDQDNRDISRSSKLAVIPFEAGFIELPIGTAVLKINGCGLNKTGCKPKYNYNDGLLRIKAAQQALDKTAGYVITVKRNN